jgi:hypothetical protein
VIFKRFISVHFIFIFFLDEKETKNQGKTMLPCFNPLHPRRFAKPTAPLPETIYVR